jgi:hypothetical protein
MIKGKKKRFTIPLGWVLKSEDLGNSPSLVADAFSTDGFYSGFFGKTMLKVEPTST